MKISVGWGGETEVLAHRVSGDSTQEFYLLDKYQTGGLAFPLNYDHQVWEQKPTDIESKLRGTFDNLEDAQLFLEALCPSGTIYDRTRQTS